MSAADVKEMVYHCECRRFVSGTQVAPCQCHECGRVHSPTGGNGHNEWNLRLY